MAAEFLSLLLSDHFFTIGIFWYITAEAITFLFFLFAFPPFHLGDFGLHFSGGNTRYFFRDALFSFIGFGKRFVNTLLCCIFF